MSKTIYTLLYRIQPNKYIVHFGRGYA